MIKLFMSAVVASVVAVPAIAQENSSPRESGGTISGNFNLEPAVWSVESVDGELTSSWTPTDTGRFLRIVGVARQSGETDLTDALVITFRAAGNPTEPEAEDPTVAHFPAGSDQSWIAEDENIDFSVEALEVSGETMVVAGSFLGQLTPRGTEGLVAEGADSIPVDGNFQATLRLDEEMSLPDVIRE